MKHLSRLLLIAVCASTATMTTGAQGGWTSLWNGKNLDEWTVGSPGTELEFAL